MIKSLTFTGEYGYISEKLPITSKRYMGRGKNCQRKNKKNQHIITQHWLKNLLDRTFHFEPNKINLIFGPNGKTTILKALGGVAGTTDGYAQLYSPLAFMTLVKKLLPIRLSPKEKKNDVQFC